MRESHVECPYCGSAVRPSLRTTFPVAMVRAIVAKVGGIEKVRQVRAALTRTSQEEHPDYLRRVADGPGASTLVAWAVLGMTVAELAEGVPPPAPASLGDAYGREIAERESAGWKVVGGRWVKDYPAPASGERCEFCGATDPADRRLYGNINDRYPCVGTFHNTPPREGGKGGES